MSTPYCTHASDAREFFEGYCEAAAFTSLGDLDQPPHGSILARDSLEDAAVECAAFQLAAAPLLARAYQRDGYSAAQAGHDFWLTRNGHGAGFWDRKPLDGELGEALTRLAKDAGEIYPEWEDEA